MLCKDRSDAVAKLRDEEKAWKWERAGWVLMAIFLIVGLANALNPSFRSKHIKSMAARSGNAMPYTANAHAPESPRATAHDNELVRVNAPYFAEYRVRLLE